MVNTNPYLTDDDGNRVYAGDHIEFTYGIPPVYVLAEVVNIDGVLWVLTPGHNPEKMKLRSLRKHVMAWYKIHSE